MTFRTFRTLEKKYLIEWSPESSISSLSEWYLSVRDTPLSDLKLESICRALRQNLFVEELMPFVEGLLEQDALAGERYDGELIAALAGLNPNIWAISLCRPYRILQVLREIPMLTDDAEVQREASILLASIERLNNDRQ